MCLSVYECAVNSSMYVFIYVQMWLGVCFYYIMNDCEINANVKAINVKNLLLSTLFSDFSSFRIQYSRLHP